MEATDYDAPEAQMQAETYIATGYQRLLTFEVDGGGFSLFGRAPADPFLTAYGLMEFTDMAQVHPVDPALLERTARWLLDRQQPDGTWVDQGYSEHWHIDSQVPTTAYITWSLIEAGYEETPQVARAVAVLRESTASPSLGEGESDDPYSLALVANALAAYDPDHATTRAILDRLCELRVEEDGIVHWQAATASFMGGSGASGSLETTALAALAFMRADVHADAVSGALTYLIQGKDSWGTWRTTQATILSLKALLTAAGQGTKADAPATVRVSLDDGQAAGAPTREIVIDQGNADVVRLVTFDTGLSPGGANRVRIDLESDEQTSNLMYQVTTRTYLPWDAVKPTPALEPLIAIDVAYDRTELAVNDEVSVDVEARLKEGMVQMALIDLGVPPGFDVLVEDLRRLVERGIIARYELTGRQVILYVEDLSSGTPLRFSLRLRARFPLRAQTPPSSAYDYYNPETVTVLQPQQLTVSE
jgi:uncharacterized protein YfaS (alpha-2-macroglobulin family)